MNRGEHDAGRKGLYKLPRIEDAVRGEGSLHRSMQGADFFGDGQRPPALLGQTDAVLTAGQLGTAVLNVRSGGAVESSEGGGESGEFACHEEDREGA